MKQKREEKGMSLREVGEAMNRHHSVIGKMEQNRQKIDLYEFIRYCNAVGANPHEGLDAMISSIDTEN